MGIKSKLAVFLFAALSGCTIAKPVYAAVCENPWPEVYAEAVAHQRTPVEVKGTDLRNVIAGYNAQPPVGDIKADQVFAIVNPNQTVSIAFVKSGCAIEFGSTAIDMWSDWLNGRTSPSI